VKPFQLPQLATQSHRSESICTQDIAQSNGEVAFNHLKSSADFKGWCLDVGYKKFECLQQSEQK